MHNEESKLEPLLRGITESTIRLEVNQEHLVKAVTELTDVTKEITLSNSRLENQVTKVKEDMQKALECVDQDVQEVRVSISGVKDQVGELEKKVANFDGQNVSRTKDWQKTIALLAFLGSMMALIYKVYTA